MNKSEKTNELFAALAKAQAVMKPAEKDKANPFFKSRYADLASVWNVCRKPLTENGLCIAQPVSITPEGNVAVETVLAHISDQWISSSVVMKPTKNDPQGVGSAITYGKRYGLSALVGVVTDDEEDDDGDKASLPGKARAEDGGTVTPVEARKPDMDGAKEKCLLAIFAANDIDAKKALDYFGENGCASFEDVSDKTIAKIEANPAKFKKATEREVVK